ATRRPDQDEELRVRDVQVERVDRGSSAARVDPGGLGVRDCSHADVRPFTGRNVPDDPSEASRPGDRRRPAIAAHGKRPAHWSPTRSYCPISADLSMKRRLGAWRRRAERGLPRVDHGADATARAQPAGGHPWLAYHHNGTLPAWRNWQRTRLVIGRFRVRVPASAPRNVDLTERRSNGT